MTDPDHWMYAQEPEGMTKNEAGLTRPIIGIENRTAQEVFDIMCDRFKGRAAHTSPGDVALREALEAKGAAEMHAAVMAALECYGFGSDTTIGQAIGKIRAALSGQSADGGVLEHLRQSAAKLAPECDRLADAVPLVGEPDPLWWERQATLREAATVMRYYAAAVAGQRADAFAMREAAAKVAAEYYSESGWNGHYKNAGAAIATAIRALPLPATPAQARAVPEEVVQKPTWRIAGQGSHFGPYVTIDGVPHDQVVLCFWRNQIQPIHLRLPGQAYVADLLRLMDEHQCSEVAIIPVRHRERVSLTRAALSSGEGEKRGG